MKTLIEISILLLALISKIETANVQFQCGKNLEFAHTNPKPFPSPSFGQKVDERIYCTYSIEAQTPTKVIKFIFEYFKIKNTGNCAKNYVKIWDGAVKDNQLLSHKCGEDSPGIVISTKGLTTLQYEVDSQSLDEGFIAQIQELNKPEFADCGPLSLNASAKPQVFKSGGEGNLISYPISCKYEIKTTHDHMTLRLSFQKFKIEGAKPCESSFVKIFNGEETGQLLKQNCGSDSPEEVKSTGGLLTVVYAARNQSLYGGFQALVNQEVSCGITNLDAIDGTRFLKSPGYEADLPFHINCNYTITAKDEGMVVQLSFKKFIIGNYPNCDHGYVKIWDGTQTDENLISLRCGQDNPGEITSRSNKLIVQYMVDSQQLLEGFVAEFEQVTKPQSATCDSESVTATSKTTLLKSTGQGNQILYPILCKHKITAEDANMVVIINFEKFNIMKDEKCANSYVKVYDGDDQAGHLLKTNCGTDNPGVVQSTGKIMTIVYKASGQSLNGGFEAQIQQAQKTSSPTTECNQMLMVAAGESKTINMYDGETTLQRGKQCMISIKTTAGYQLELKFTEFQFKGNNGSCAEGDYLQIEDGSKLQPGTVKMCGPKPPDPYVSSNNEMIIVYIASDLTYTKGFKATVTGVQNPTTPTIQCNQLLTVPAGGSANVNMYESSLKRGESCLLPIKTTEGYHLQLGFTLFQFKGTNGSCTDSDYLQFGDGLTLQSGAAKMCGTEPPSTFVSSNSGMFINYMATDPTATKGFKATVTSVSAAGWKGVSICLMALLSTFSIIDL